MDQQGEWLESAWDALNVVSGAKSAWSNYKQGNYGAAALDAGGVLVDTAAVILPGVPGGAGALIKAGRVAGEADDAIDALRKGENVLDNARNGLRRERAVAEELAQQYGDDAVQGQQLLRNAEGAKAVDPLTGTGRRLDAVVIQEGTAVRSVEVTSPTASNAARIREAGGTFVRDRNTVRLVNIEDIPTEEIRVP